MALALLGAPAACSDSSTCVEVSTECEPLYEPTFQNIFTNTLQQSCGVAGSQCHAQEGGKGGLVFADIDDAYALLTGAGGGEPRVDPHAPGCGELVSRIAASDASRVMPPGRQLPASEICAIVQWVSMGAPR